MDQNKGVRVLLIGSGGREHAIAWKLAQSPRLGELYIAPGNGGTQQFGENVPIPATDIDALLKFALENKIDLTIVGPDDPLEAGIVDRFQEEGLRIFGPTKAAAEIEWSKAFSKELMKQYGIPTASYGVFSDPSEARRYVRTHYADRKVVIKASGLALGKGSYVCNSLREAEVAIAEIMVQRVHKDAGNKVVIEDYLEGQEVSIHALSDGKSYEVFPVAQDHKAAFDGGLGPNTGGMGTISPVPGFTFTSDMEDLIIGKALTALDEKDAPFVGMLFPGLKLSPDGPKVLEYNGRLGDPETQVYMRRMKGDFLDFVEACVDGRLDEVPTITWRNEYAVCIIAASDGYPGSYQKGFLISGIEEAEELEDVVVFHAGTKYENGQLVTSGGRVLGVTALGETLADALVTAYRALKRISFEGMQYRTDIGKEALSVVIE